MSLTPWKNLPNKTTPVTAENLKNDTDYLNGKFSNSIIGNNEIITSGTAWTEMLIAPITVPKGKYLVVAELVGIPNDALIAITNTNASIAYTKNNSFSGRANLSAIGSFDSSTTLKISFNNSSNFSNVNLNCTLRAIKISD